MLHILSTEHAWRDWIIVTLLFSAAFVVLSVRDFIEKTNLSGKFLSHKVSVCLTEEYYHSVEKRKLMTTIARNRLYDRDEIELLKQQLSTFKFGTESVTET